MIEDREVALSNINGVAEGAVGGDVVVGEGVLVGVVFECDAVVGSVGC